MASEVFVDSGGFFAILVKKDDRHREALDFLREANRRKRTFVTTDHVVDETATLLKARGNGHVLPVFFESLEPGNACRVEWTDADRFGVCQEFFLKHADQAWSFTDCLSFHVMRELRLRDSLSKDHHFRDAGFNPLLI